MIQLKVGDKFKATGTTVVLIDGAYLFREVPLEGEDQALLLQLERGCQIEVFRSKGVLEKEREEPEDAQD